MIAQMLLSVAMLSALLVASKAQLLDQKIRMMSGQLVRPGGSHRRLLQGGQFTPGMVWEGEQAATELFGEYPSSCDADKLESNEYFSKAAKCYNVASLEINVENRDAYYEDSAMFSTCYKPCRDVHDMIGNSCGKDLAADAAQLFRKWAAEADQNSFPSPDEREAFELLLNAGSRIDEAVYGLPEVTLNDLLSLGQDTIAENYRESARELESLPFGDLGPVTPCVDSNDAMVSGATCSNYLYAALAFLAVLI